MNADSDYSRDADYVPPPSAKGLALHGYIAGENFEADGAVITPITDKNCPGPVTLADLRRLPADFPERTHTEFWFYRSGDQGLYLARSWQFEVSETCKPIARIKTELVRLSFFNGTVSFIHTQNGGAPTLSTQKVAEPGFYPIPDELVVISKRRLREMSGSGRRQRDTSRSNTGVRQACFDTSITFSFSNQCFLDEPGSWRGLLTFSTREEDDGSAYSQYGLVSVQSKALIDGRIFEWDRAVTYRDK